ncbi:MAG: metallophosphoesterase [Sedimentisphaerales bacterium]|nr:metallophosphoesterase [Sedimentisphaerales bacterium]
MMLQEKVSVALFVLAILSIYGFEAIWLARAAWNRICRRGKKNRRLRKRVLLVHVLAVVGLMCMLYGYLVEPAWLDVRRVTIPTAKLRDVSLRIVHISDLHCDRRPRNEEKMVEIVNALTPDVVVATGDLLNDPSALPRLRETLRRLEAPLGKFAVEGNFEVWHWPQLDMLEGTGFRFLRRDSAVVAKGSEEICISGLSIDRATACRDLLGALPDDRFNLFLFHTPDLIEDVNGLGVDLYLCGHTHGGQVALPLYGALLTFSKFGKKYESGLHRCGTATLYVNRGIGLEPRPAPQVRFCARPEIVVFDIVPARSQASP